MSNYSYIVEINFLLSHFPQYKNANIAKFVLTVPSEMN